MCLVLTGKQAQRLNDRGRQANAYFPQAHTKLLYYTRDDLQLAAFIHLSLYLWNVNL